jgi:hypothetical protein
MPSWSVIIRVRPLALLLPPRWMACPGRYRLSAFRPGDSPGRLHHRCVAGFGRVPRSPCCLLRALIRREGWLAVVRGRCCTPALYLQWADKVASDFMLDGMMIISARFPDSWQAGPIGTFKLDRDRPHFARPERLGGANIAARCVGAERSD